MSLRYAGNVNSFPVKKKGEFKSFGCRNATRIPGKYGQFVFMSVMRLRVGGQL